MQLWVTLLENAHTWIASSRREGREGLSIWGEMFQCGGSR